MIIKNEPWACVATNVQNMLTKQWTEESDAYRLYTRIDDHREHRIKELLSQNRYDNKCVD
jgi:hypothetical protein